MADARAEYETLRAKCAARTATSTEVRRCLALAARFRTAEAAPAGLTSTQAPKATKLSGLLVELRAGRVREALAIAARFPDLGDERAAILDGHAAFTTPDFIRQIGRDPEALIAAGRAALERRYGATA